MNPSADPVDYEFYAKGVANPFPVRSYTDQIVWQVKEACGADVDVEVHIEPEVQGKGVYHVSLIVSGFTQPVVVNKTGRHILNLLRKVKRTALRKVHKVTKRQHHLEKRKRIIRFA